ncbi:hypothetical protein GcM3_000018 [Golovinomyces cichoracearum]|uniref:Uncharacterized protein n=1 Tax=Golovinomyces cichoracearum TaxID=62708 RepID=A0A420JBF7_9PEZI|nr:hypothetical protein GcM3_000018 [Golovinomyces cichoracearum]
MNGYHQETVVLGVNGRTPPKARSSISKVGPRDLQLSIFFDIFVYFFKIILD